MSSTRFRIIRLTSNLLKSNKIQFNRIENRSITSNSSTIYSELDPFAAVDKLNGNHNKPNSKPIINTKQSTISKKSYTSIPPSITINSTSQSSEIESHPSTSVEDLHPLPASTAQIIDTDIDITPSRHRTTPSTSLHQSSDLSDGTINWSRSFSGLSEKPFAKEASDILMAPINPMDVEIKPDGVIYLPEIKYRRILNRAFGPGGWGLAPRGSSHITPKNVSREYGLVCLGRLVSVARGEQDYYNGADNIPTATEGCKSNALMRCCKDLGIASELWDPNYIQWWKNKYASVEWIPGTGLSSGKKKPVWKKKKLDDWTPNLP